MTDLKTLLPFVAVYLVMMNLLGFVSMGYDKRRARAHGWRVPEASLFLVAVMGGSVGSLAGMHAFRHKTKHRQFTIGMPVILIAQIALIAVALYQFGLLA